MASTFDTTSMIKRKIPRAVIGADSIVHCNFDTPLHPHWASAHRKSLEWVAHMGYSRPQEEAHAVLERANFAWLAAAAYPYLSDDCLQICVDFMQWYFLYDDAFVNPAGPDALANLRFFQEELLGILRRQPLRSKSNPHARGLQDIYERILSCPGDDRWLKRFQNNMQGYFEANRWVLLHRIRKTTPPMSEYARFRWLDIGIPPSLDLGAYLWGMSFSDPYFESSTFEEINRTTAAAVFFTNDVLGFHKDQELDDMTNSIFVLMREHKITLGHAKELACQLCNQEIESFRNLAAQIEPMGFTRSEDVERYLYLSKCWIRGHLNWYGISRRYLETGSILTEAEKFFNPPEARGFGETARPDFMHVHGIQSEQQQF